MPSQARTQVRLVDTPRVCVHHIPINPDFSIVCGVWILLDHLHLHQLALVVVHRGGTGPAREVVAPAASVGQWGSLRQGISTQVLSQAGVALKVNDAPARNCRGDLEARVVARHDDSTRIHLIGGGPWGQRAHARRRPALIPAGPTGFLRAGGLDQQQHKSARKSPCHLEQVGWTHKRARLLRLHRYVRGPASAVTRAHRTDR